MILYWDGFFLGLLLASALWVVSAFLFNWYCTRLYGKRELFAKEAGSAIKGSAYAFTLGMMPWAKESIRQNPFSYTMGIAYHVGIFTALAHSALYIYWSLIAAVRQTPSGYMPHGIFAIIIIMLLAFGVIGGMWLFIKRLFSPTLRGISCLDDYISNFLTTVYVGFTLIFAISLLSASLLHSNIIGFLNFKFLIGFLKLQFLYMWVSRLWTIATIVLFVYIPFSKIRHCLFFFITRYHFGAFFGRRGCMPPNK